MEFGLTLDQRMISENFASLLKRSSPLERVRAAAKAPAEIAADVWRAIAEMGACALLVPEEQGGLGLSLLEAALVAETLGHAVAPTPFVGSCVLAPLALREAGSAGQQAEWLPRLAAGEIRATVAIEEHAGGARDGATLAWRDGRLTGHLLFALDAAGADLLIAAGDDGRLYLVPTDAPGLALTPLLTIDRTRQVGKFSFADVAAEPLERSSSAALARIIQAGRVILAADTLGAASAMIEQAVAFALERKQFGRVVGSFQSVKHMCAEMAAELEPCRAFLWYAAYAMEAAPGDFGVAANQFKAHLSEVASRIAGVATQVHGGMGFTDLLGLHFWFKRIGFNRQLLGSPERCRADAATLQGWTAGDG